MTPVGNPQSPILYVLDMSVVGAAWVCVPNRCSVVDVRSPNRLIRQLCFCCPQDVSAKALRILFLLDTNSANVVAMLVE